MELPPNRGAATLPLTFVPNSMVAPLQEQSERFEFEPLPGDSYNLGEADNNFEPEEFVSSDGSSACSGEFDDNDPQIIGDNVSNSESEEEEDLDFLDEDEESESEALIFDQLFLKFRHVLDSRVDDAERFFDRGLLRPCNHVDVAIQTEENSNNNDPSSSLTRLNNVPSCSGRPQFIHQHQVETQTDDCSASALMSSSREEPSCARSEIAKLRDAREPLNLERKLLIQRLKAVKKGVGGRGTSYSVRWEEKQLFELEEAIEAIDLAIEFKNEIICGQETTLDDKLAPGQERAELVTRLASLSVFDLQRLFCKFFVKVVELRFCTKRLERNVEKLEGERDRMGRMITTCQNSLEEKDDEHEKRIKLLLHQSKSGGVVGDILWMTLTQELSKAKRKLLDFQHALTELLVKHGYLLNGADYDVRHVVKTLCLDFGELELKHLEAGSRPGHHKSSLSHHHQPRRNINQRRNAEPENDFPINHHSGLSSSKKHHSEYKHGQKGSSSCRDHHHQTQRQAQPHSSSSRHHYAPFEGYRDRGRSDKDTRDRERHSRHQNSQFQEEVSPQHGTEVKRFKKKLIIQPNSSP